MTLKKIPMGTKMLISEKSTKTQSNDLKGTFYRVYFLPIS